MKKWLALLAVAALVLSLGGCGGSSSSSGGSSSGSSPSGKTYTGQNGTVTAEDASGNKAKMTVTNASLSVGTISSTGSVAVAAQSTTASFSCTLSDDKGNTGNINKSSQTVSVAQSGSLWTFTFSDGLKVELDTSYMTITLGGTMPSVTMGGTSYTLTDDFTINVSEGSGGGGGSDDPGSGGGGTTVDVSSAVTITLNSDGTATCDGTSVPQADWVWSMDLGVDHWQGGDNETYNFVKNSPAEFFIGTEPSDDIPVYIAHDIVYLPDTLKSSFTGTAKKDNETVCTCNYSDSVIAASISAIQEKYTDVSTMKNCIFAALDKNPAQDSSAEDMLHSASEAYNNPVLHIKGAGTYILKGTWNGQIWIEGEDEDEDKVQVILDGVTVTCSVGPAFIFTDFYECDTAQSGAYDVSTYTADAGVKVFLSDGTTNTVTGANLPRILKIQPKYDSDDDEPTKTTDGTDVDQQKKRYKWDGAFHSRVSMVINGGNSDGSASSGTGVLKVVSSTCEGLNSEMHLVIDGGAISVKALDDGINVNEDNISVFRMNAGTLSVTSTTNGDGVDSNGWIGFEGGSGTITSQAGGAEKDLDAVLGIWDNTGGAFTYSTVDNEKGGGNVSTTGGGQPGGGGTPPDGGNGGGTPPDGGNGGPEMQG
ncbi:MAG: carbohydrate-binding domain-containing protein [Fretibacterium sp.]|nr:carbohydrate-binding domain-containing protein [Fretibacterium sp.]